MLSRASIVASFNNALSPASVGSFHSQLQSGKRQLYRACLQKHATPDLRHLLLRHTTVPSLLHAIHPTIHSTLNPIQYPRILRQLQQATFLNPIQHPERLQQPQCATTSPRPSSRPSGRRYGPIIKCNSPHSTRTSSLSFLRPLLRLYLPRLIGLRSTFRFFSPYSLSWCCSTWCGSFSFARPWCSAVGGRRMLAETVARSERGLWVHLTFAISG
jgi:hypothetical protein